MRKLIVLVLIIILLTPSVVFAKKDKTDWQLRALEAEAAVAQLTALVMTKDQLIQYYQNFISNETQKTIIKSSQPALKALEEYKKSIEPKEK